MTASDVPLAERLRPKVLCEVVGQRHLLGARGPLAGALHSMLLWGPPGCGKTTIARLLAGREDVCFETLSPVSAGVRELKECVAAARNRGNGLEQKRTVLFVDEVHRFSRLQQDYFLPHVENGLLTLFGATTENPSFEIISALLSRLTVYRLDPLAREDLAVLLGRALAELGSTAQEDACEMILATADGDARRLLNLAEQLCAGGGREITGADVEKAVTASLRRFDKRGDEFYDQISALHKSVRGSDPDAALYWLSRMLDGGADPAYLVRRMIRMAVEDVGMAEPQALRVALDANEQYRVLGSPEGELGIAMAAVFLSCAPKSNSVYVADKRMREYVCRSGSAPVPAKLRNAPTRLMKQMGNSAGYRFPHSCPHGYAAGEDYFPERVATLRAYRPLLRGFERRVAERLAKLRELDEQERVSAGDRQGTGRAAGGLRN